MPIIEDTVIDQNGHKTKVRIEVSKDHAAITRENDPDRQTRGRNSATDQVKDAFQEAMKLIETCATQVAHTVHNISPTLRPKECEIQFAVKIDGKVGAFIAESSAGAQIQVTLKWGGKDDSR